MHINGFKSCLNYCDTLQNMRLIRFVWKQLLNFFATLCTLIGVILKFLFNNKSISHTRMLPSLAKLYEHHLMCQGQFYAQIFLEIAEICKCCTLE